MAGDGGMTPPQPTSIIVAEDHVLVRQGLVEILRAQPDFHVVGEVSDGIEAVAKTRELRPDIVLMDLAMPGLNGVEATRVLACERYDCKIVILTGSADKGDLIEAIKAGANGYLLKTMDAGDLVRALRGLRDGAPVLAPSLTGHVVDELRRLAGQQPGTPDEGRRAEEHRAEGRGAEESRPPLTKREEDVLALVAQGRGDKQIARTLSISVYTVKTHIRNILAKLQVSGRQEAVMQARRDGLL
jgi:DNA-binding NarL/FixJ family response regulator